jgi:hypothetical protein
VKGHEGHHVTLKGKADESAKSITVTSVTMVGEKGAGKSKSKKMPASPSGK